MIPLLLIYLFKYFPGLKTYLTRFKLPLLITVAILFGNVTYAENIKLDYSIKRNGKIIGHLNYKKVESDNLVIYRIESNVSDKFIFPVVVAAREESIYENGFLKSSSVYRTHNGDVKENKKVFAYENKFYATENNETVTTGYYPVTFGVMHLFINEPYGRNMIYAENAQKLIPIKKIAEHHYKVSFPNGSYNHYYYINGICTKVEIHHTLFSVTIELK